VPTIDAPRPLTEDELAKPLSIAEWSTIVNCIGVALEHVSDEGTIRYLVALKERATHRRDELSHGRVVP
jgi:hypothetical protein